LCWSIAVVDDFALIDRCGAGFDSLDLSLVGNDGSIRLASPRLMAL
jgi:hypothetical protein